MTEQQQESSRFLQILNRIRSSVQLRAEDAESIRSLAVNTRTRQEEEITGDRGSSDKTRKSEFMQRGFGGHPVLVFASIAEGLSHAGWAEIPDGGLHAGSGMFGVVHVGYKLTDAKVKLEARHLCAIKRQTPGVRRGRACRVDESEDYRQIWNEVEILRGVVHENIVDYFTHFAVVEGKVTHILILMEYASAGALSKELDRFPGHVIPEPGARYYTLQICSGIEYLHNKQVTHGDLHTGNVVLKYNPDGTKTCLICDFGLSPAFYDSSWVFEDILCIGKLATIMMQGYARDIFRYEPSREAKKLINATDMGGIDFPETIAELKEKFTWFQGKAVAPMPKPQTPLVERRVVAKMGYLPERQPPPGWSITDRAARALKVRMKSKDSKPQERRRPESASSSESQHSAQAPAAEATAVAGPSRVRTGSQPPHPALPAHIAAALANPPSQPDARPHSGLGIRQKWNSLRHFLRHPIRTYRRRNESRETHEEPEKPALPDSESKPSKSKR